MAKMKTARSVILAAAIVLSLVATSQTQVKAVSESPLSLERIKQLRKEWGPFAGPWKRYGRNPVFKPTGDEKDFDGIFLQHACPVKVDDQWRLYYNGWTLNPEAKNAIGAEYAIGLAFTKDSDAGR